MIARDFITEWRATAPWPDDGQVEQDLVISRALVEIFSRPALAEALAFRGGTALHKLHMRPAARYSEDIDLVQCHAGAHGPIIDELRVALSWLGVPKVKLGERTTLRYSFAAEERPDIPLRLKVEINTREHFTVYGLQSHRYEVASRWYRGAAEITTYALEELLATKLRALYQRKKGRDLFDLDLAMRGSGVDPARVVHAFERYMVEGRQRVTRAEFAGNLAAKRRDPQFVADISPLLANGHDWEIDRAFAHVLERMVALLT